MAQAQELRAKIASEAVFGAPKDTSPSEGAKQEWEKYVTYLDNLHRSEGAGEKVRHCIAAFASFATTLWATAWSEAGDEQRSSITEQVVGSTPQCHNCHCIGNKIIIGPPQWPWRCPSNLTYWRTAGSS